MRNNDCFELIYEPSFGKGEELFDGLACPTEGAYNILGDEGVKYIKKRLNQMLEWRKIMYGEKRKNHYGFSEIQFFTEVQREVVLSVGLTINNLKHKKKYFNESIPNLIIDESLIIQDYKKLHDTNHFLIEVFWKYPYTHPKMTIPEFLRFGFDPHETM